ncbi:MAG: cytochrome P450 [Cellulomonas sp.]|nr:cytochrome P450 [Cellulomonas sp.]
MSAEQTVAAQPRQQKEPEAGNNRWREALRRIVSGSWAVSLGAVILAVIVGSIMIAATDDGVRTAIGYFGSRPGDTFSAVGKAVGGAYAALFRGAVWDFHATSFTNAIRPLTNSLTQATPLITAGLGVAVGFRAGQFNIGGRGQMLIACLASANSDPERFEAPSRLDLRRDPNRHVAFGAGVHACLGAKLARAEIEIALERLFTRFPALQLAAPRSQIQYTKRMGSRGLVALPIQL